MLLKIISLFAYIVNKNQPQLKQLFIKKRTEKTKNAVFATETESTN